MRACEEIRELSVPFTHGAYYETRPPALDGSGEITLPPPGEVRARDEARPDRGRRGPRRRGVRAHAARSTPGAASCARSTRTARPRRLHALVNAALMAGENVTERVVQRVFSSALDLVVHVERTRRTGRGWRASPSGRAGSPRSCRRSPTASRASRSSCVSGRRSAAVDGVDARAAGGPRRPGPRSARRARARARRRALAHEGARRARARRSSPPSRSSLLAGHRPLRPPRAGPGRRRSGPAACPARHVAPAGRRRRSRPSQFWALGALGGVADLRRAGPRDPRARSWRRTRGRGGGGAARRCCATGGPFVSGRGRPRGPTRSARSIAADRRRPLAPPRGHRARRVRARAAARGVRRLPGAARACSGSPAALEQVKERLADPTSDRVIEVLIVAHERGGPSSATSSRTSSSRRPRTSRCSTRSTPKASRCGSTRGPCSCCRGSSWWRSPCAPGPFRDFYRSTGGGARRARRGRAAQRARRGVARAARSPADGATGASPAAWTGAAERMTSGDARSSRSRSVVARRGDGRRCGRLAAGGSADSGSDPYRAAAGDIEPPRVAERPVRCGLRPSGAAAASGPRVRRRPVGAPLAEALAAGRLPERRRRGVPRAPVRLTPESVAARGVVLGAAVAALGGDDAAPRRVRWRGRASRRAPRASRRRVEARRDADAPRARDDRPGPGHPRAGGCRARCRRSRASIDRGEGVVVDELRSISRRSGAGRSEAEAFRHAAAA